MKDFLTRDDVLWSPHDKIRVALDAVNMLAQRVNAIDRFTADMPDPRMVWEKVQDALARIDSLERRMSDAETVKSPAPKPRYEWEYRTLNSEGEEVARGPAPAVWSHPRWRQERRKVVVGEWEPVE